MCGWRSRGGFSCGVHSGGVFALGVAVVRDRWTDGCCWHKTGGGPDEPAGSRSERMLLHVVTIERATRNIVVELLPMNANGAEVTPQLLPITRNGILCLRHPPAKDGRVPGTFKSIVLNKKADAAGLKLRSRLLVFARTATTFSGSSACNKLPDAATAGRFSSGRRGRVVRAHGRVAGRRF